jgi:hypothetical protein
VATSIVSIATFTLIHAASRHSAEPSNTLYQRNE